MKVLTERGRENGEMERLNYRDPQNNFRWMEIDRKIDRKIN